MGNAEDEFFRKAGHESPLRVAKAFIYTTIVLLLVAAGFLGGLYVSRQKTVAVTTNAPGQPDVETKETVIAEAEASPGTLKKFIVAPGVEIPFQADTDNEGNEQTSFRVAVKPPKPPGEFIAEITAEKKPAADSPLAEQMDAKTPERLMELAESSFKKTEFGKTAVLLNRITNEFTLSSQAKTVETVLQMVRKRSSSHDGPLTATDVNDLYSISEGLEKIKTSYRQMTVEQKRNLDPRFETILRRDDIDIDSLGRFSLVLERMDLLVAKDIGTDNADAAQMKAILKRGENERLAWVDEFKNESVPQKPDYYITVPNGARHTKSVLVPGAKDIAFQNAKSDALSKLAKLKGKFLPKLDFIEGSIGLIWFGMPIHTAIRSIPKKKSGPGATGW